MILLFHGNDEVSLNRKLSAIKAQYHTKYSGVSFYEFDGEKFNLESFKESLNVVSFFDNHKLIIVTDLFKFQKKDVIKEVVKTIQNLNPETTLIFKESEEPKSKDLTKLENYKPYAFVAPKHSLSGWIIKEASRQGAELDSSAANALMLKAGSDMWRLYNEIAKLAAYDSHISAANIELLVHGDDAANIFAFVDAIASRNKKESLSALKRLIDAGESPNAIFGLLIKQIESLILVKDLIGRGNSEQEIVLRTKLHPYVVKKSARSAGAFEPSELKDAISHLAHLDMSVRSGEMEALEALLKFTLSSGPSKTFSRA